MEIEIKQMTNDSIEDQVSRLEEDYTEALNQDADIHVLSKIWQEIKELKSELKSRNPWPVKMRSKNFVINKLVSI